MIDCDVHNTLRSVEELLPYLAAPFRDWVERGETPGYTGLGKSFPAAHRPWLHPEGVERADLEPRNGGPIGSDYELMCEQLLDRYGHEYAVLTSDEVPELSTLANPYYAQALASAYNDYLVEEWLPRDPRLKGSLVIAPQNPEGAAAEIRRLGGHPDIVQTLTTSGSQRPYGDPFYHPIWDACAEVGIPFGVHLGGTAGVNALPNGTGPTTFFWETHALFMQTGMGHVASTIAHGVFEKWPNARLVLIETGMAWLPSLLWRLNEDYRPLRKETPWLKRLPSEYAYEHIRLTTQPLERPLKRQEALWEALDDIGGRDMLMFSSDYPHWDFEDPKLVRLPAEWRETILDTNARKLYGLPERKDSQQKEVVAGGAA